jgi:hypothetical protein
MAAPLPWMLMTRRTPSLKRRSPRSWPKRQSWSVALHTPVLTHTVNAQSGTVGGVFQLERMRLERTTLLSPHPAVPRPVCCPSISVTALPCRLTYVCLLAPTSLCWGVGYVGCLRCVRTPLQCWGMMNEGVSEQEGLVGGWVGGDWGTHNSSRAAGSEHLAMLRTLALHPARASASSNE